MSNIERNKLDNQILLSYYRHRGDIFAISAELQIPVDYVEKIVKKIKNRQKRDCDFLLSSTIMEHILLGVNQRTKVLTDTLETLNKHVEKYVSQCCSSLFTVRVGLDDRPTYFCQECGLICNVICKLETDCVTLINETVENLRNEDDAIVKFAEKLGFTNREELPTTKITQYNFNMASDKSVDKKIVEDVSKLNPAERMQLRRTIESKILDEPTDTKKSEKSKGKNK